MAPAWLQMEVTTLRERHDVAMTQANESQREAHQLRTALSSVEAKLLEYQRKDVEVRPRGRGRGRENMYRIQHSLDCWPQLSTCCPCLQQGWDTAKMMRIAESFDDWLYREFMMLYTLVSKSAIKKHLAWVYVQVYARIKEAMEVAEEAKLARDSLATRLKEVERENASLQQRLASVRQVGAGMSWCS